MSDWKPCRKLVAADFRRHRLWGFDRARERRGAADETWVRPVRLAKAPASSDLLFLAAKVRSRGGAWRPGAVTLQFVDGAPALDGVVLLRPRYCAMRVHGGVVPASERGYVERVLDGRAADAFPLEFRARLRVGRRALPIAGRVTAAWA
ncbi:MAG TPA: hypothetical protein VLW85_10250 [Myxococcales bacterium]|nr:hypothetical protein [Myxococcales bacterium]